MAKNNALAAVNSTDGFLALQDFNLSDVMAEELSGLSVSFERIKIPIGGGTVFKIPGDEPDDMDTLKEVNAVILYQHTLNAYYATKYAGGSHPPDCGSFDGVTGRGNPGGLCRNCPYNEFGSGENGAKACKNRRRLYLLREGDVFPVILSLPTGSLKGFTRYLMRILPKYKSSNAVVTRFTLKKATSGTGVIYSQAQFSVVRALTLEERTLIAAMTEQVKAVSMNVGYDAEDTIPPHVDPDTGEIIEPLR